MKTRKITKLFALLLVFLFLLPLFCACHEGGAPTDTEKSNTETFVASSKTDVSAKPSSDLSANPSTDAAGNPSVTEPANGPSTEDLPEVEWLMEPQYQGVSFVEGKTDYLIVRDGAASLRKWDGTILYTADSLRIHAGLLISQKAGKYAIVGFDGTVFFDYQDKYIAVGPNDSFLLAKETNVPGLGGKYWKIDKYGKILGDYGTISEGPFKDEGPVYYVYDRTTETLNKITRVPNAEPTMEVVTTSEKTIVYVVSNLRRGTDGKIHYDYPAYNGVYEDGKLHTEQALYTMWLLKDDPDPAKRIYVAQYEGSALVKVYLFDRTGKQLFKNAFDYIHRGNETAFVASEGRKVGIVKMPTIE